MSLWFKDSGTMIPVSDEYQAVVRGNICELLHRKTNYWEVVTEKTLCSVTEFLEPAEKIITKYGIISWAGWHEHALVTDSYFFDFILQYNDGQSIEAHGYGAMPNEDAMKELRQLFSLFLGQNADKDIVKVIDWTDDDLF